MKKQVENTIKDIALKLGLSPSTVSRGLKDHPHINEKTKKKIKLTAAKLGYKHNAIAASLRNNKSNTIGLIVPKISMFYQSAVITAIQNKLHEHKYNLMICQSNESVEMEKELVNALYASRVEGLIVSATLNTVDFSHFDVFSKSNCPLVFFDRIPTDYAANKIEGDEFNGGYMATKHLLEQGCRRIAHIGGPLTCNLYRGRFEGYKEALKAYGLSVDNDIVYFHDLTAENGLKTGEKLFAKNPFPDAIFACNDTTAVTIIQYAKSIGLAVPSKLKVIGYSNGPLSQIVDPPLTSIEQYTNKVGAEAATMMMELINQKLQLKESFRKVTVPVDLIKRNSTSNNQKTFSIKKIQRSELKILPVKQRKLNVK
ncbi:MAG: LacI family DNA-binding transcriptional regulator [Chitinophagaceae bacterium]|nr:LacI family DNA-binding transcriptional regulator [Chitinophagaceae bacterium]